MPRGRKRKVQSTTDSINKELDQLGLIIQTIDAMSEEAKIRICGYIKSKFAQYFEL